MWKRLDRYFYTELTIPFSITLIFLTFILLLHQLLRIMDLYLLKGGTLLLLGKIFLLILPAFLLVTLPAATLIASLVTFSRFSSDGEITALKSAGISLYRIIRPLFVFSLVITLITLFISLKTTPWAGTSFKDMALNLLTENVSIIIEEGTFSDLSNQIMIYVEKIDNKTHLQGILISDLRKPKEEILIVAKEGSFKKTHSNRSVIFQLHQGTIHHRNPNPNNYERILFDYYNLTIPIHPSSNSPSTKPPSLNEIKTMLDLSKGEDIRALRYLQEYHRNFSFPFACLIFGLMGAPLGIGFKKSNRLAGFIFGILVLLIYYSLGVLGDILVTRQTIPPWLGAWLPNFIAILFTLWLIGKHSKRIG